MEQCRADKLPLGIDKIRDFGYQREFFWVVCVMQYTHYRSDLNEGYLN